jgi:hypothetical protein
LLALANELGLLALGRSLSKEKKGREEDGHQQGYANGGFHRAIIPRTG